MIRWATILVLIGAIGFLAAWAADNPGQVVIQWLDYRIETSAAFLTALTALVTGVISYAYIAFHHFLGLRKRLAQRQRIRRYEHGLRYLTRSVAALAGSDVITAEKYAERARLQLGETPMGLLISAQISKSRGDEERTRMLLNQMFKHRETEQIAERLLSGKKEPPPSKMHEWGRKLRSFIKK